ncbi:hypothetical protein [Nitrospirillum pindoramense]|uniref:DUF2946 family protein n=1 Tax=Nitrospirillum amazonense TaxID=28077 RepID=A0A560GYK0_9PROT|nr:hypothetical protein [Nitrospirillum amazonense]TWB39113.1 hypothetical protein FBZ90_111110 [Nitrospirillum amazonense]
MQPRRHHRARGLLPQGRQPRRWVWLLALALLLRGLIPAGYMPNPHAGEPGASAVILCDSVHDALSVMTDALMAKTMMADPAMTQAMLANPGMHHHGDHAGHGMDAPCVFAAVAALAVGLLAVILVLPTQPRAPGWAPALSAPWPRPRPPGTRLARGPPPIFS